MSQTCTQCRGQGQIIERPCSTCKGRGATRKSSTITVKIPPGVREGTSLRISGSGEAGARGGPAGDLFVVVHVARDKKFTREGDDLYLEEPISIPQAAFGAEIQVETMEDPVTIKIPPGTQSGTLFRLRDRGMPHLGARGNGDQLVKVTVTIPKTLTNEQRDILRQFAKSLGENTSRYDDSVLRRIFGH